MCRTLYSKRGIKKKKISVVEKLCGIVTVLKLTQTYVCHFCTAKTDSFHSQLDRYCHFVGDIGVREGRTETTFMSV